MGAELEVEGFLFGSPEDAEKARVDAQKRDLLINRYGNARPAQLLTIYEKAIENRIFKTPVGWEYLAGVRKRLIDSGIREESISPIPVDLVIARAVVRDAYVPRQRIQPPPPKKDIHYRTILSLAVNIILLILVVVMFMVAYYSDTDNILNYKENVTNRYAGWQQELSAREQQIREKERELGIEEH